MHVLGGLCNEAGNREFSDFSRNLLKTDHDGCKMNMKVFFSFFCTVHVWHDVKKVQVTRCHTFTPLPVGEEGEYVAASDLRCLIIRLCTVQSPVQTANM